MSDDSPIILDGRPVAQEMLTRAKASVSVLDRAPHLVAILANDRAESRAYLEMKRRAADSIGVQFSLDALDRDAWTTENLSAHVRERCAEEGVDGVMVQLPLAEGIDVNAVLDSLDPEKDVDGLHVVNQGATLLATPGIPSATAAACIAILDFYDVSLSGALVTVVGRSRLVGRPLIGLLLQRDATVTVCHTETRDLATQTLAADIVIVASGKPGTVDAKMIRPGATVVDVGWSRVDGGIIGDAHSDIKTVVGALTPVPGGVGPVTVAQLMRSVVAVASQRESL
jgi:methylenetetrahydrofolate dehydrogenase (NADP+) / methenyltetrahydrofolate cyclohydrolase